MRSLRLASLRRNRDRALHWARPRMDCISQHRIAPHCWPRHRLRRRAGRRRNHRKPGARSRGHGRRAPTDGRACTAPTVAGRTATRRFAIHAPTAPVALPPVPSQKTKTTTTPGSTPDHGSKPTPPTSAGSPPVAAPAPPPAQPRRHQPHRHRQPAAGRRPGAAAGNDPTGCRDPGSLSPGDSSDVSLPVSNPASSTGSTTASTPAGTHPSSQSDGYDNGGTITLSAVTPASRLLVTVSSSGVSISSVDRVRLERRSARAGLGDSSHDHSGPPGQQQPQGRLARTIRRRRLAQRQRARRQLGRKLRPVGARRTAPLSRPLPRRGAAGRRSRTVQRKGNGDRTSRPEMAPTVVNGACNGRPCRRGQELPAIPRKGEGGRARR